MALRRPLVVVSGVTSELPPGDSVVGAQAGTLVAGSGLNGGGGLFDGGTVTVNVSLAAAPSGLIFVGDALGLDGTAQVSADNALASGNAAQVSANTALASGNAAQVSANTALASGNAAQVSANTALASGNAGIAAAITKLPLSGGVVSGQLAQNIVPLGLYGSGINTGLGNYFTATISGNSTIVISGSPSNVSYGFVYEVNHQLGTISWPSEVNWPTNTAPTLTTGKTHVFTFVTDDGGSRWRGAALVDYVT